MQGAKPKARLDALPGFATPQTARKTTSPAGWGEIGRFARQIPCMGVQPMRRDVGGQLIPIAPQRDPQIICGQVLKLSDRPSVRARRPRHHVGARARHAERQRGRDQRPRAPRRGASRIASGRREQREPRGPRHLDHARRVDPAHAQPEGGAEAAQEVAQVELDAAVEEDDDDGGDAGGEPARRRRTEGKDLVLRE